MRTKFSKLFGSIFIILMLAVSLFGAPPAAALRAAAAVHASSPVGEYNRQISGFTNPEAAAGPITTTTRVSVDSSGLQENSWSERSSISADGRYVAFESYASNLVSGDTNGQGDIFLRDTQTGTTTLSRRIQAGHRGTTDSEYPSISADGRYVAFESGCQQPGQRGYEWKNRCLRA
jgi:hypothetical protein